MAVSNADAHACIKRHCGAAGFLVALAGGIWAASAITDFSRSDDDPLTHDEVRTNEILKIAMAIALALAGVALALVYFRPSCTPAI